MDEDPPNDSPLSYVVVGYDADPVTGDPRPGPDSDVLTVIKRNSPPETPLTLTATLHADGDTKLTWVRPGIWGDPDAPGDSIDFYRVYRDGITYADRYARWDDDSL